MIQPEKLAQAVALRTETTLSLHEISKITDIGKSTLAIKLKGIPKNPKNVISNLKQPKKNLVGTRFTRLVVLEWDSSSKRKWKCKCDCGNTTFVRVDSLQNGEIKSCGCLAAETSRTRHRFAAPHIASKKALVRDYKAGAKRRNLEFLLTDDECEILFKGNCYYCGIKPCNIKNTFKRKDGTFKKGKESSNEQYKTWADQANYLYNGIDRIDNNKFYLKENCVSACTTCNNAKKDMSFDAFNAWVDRLVNYRLNTSE